MREARTPEDLVAIHELLMIMGDEHARAPVNPAKVLRDLVDGARNPDRNVMLMAIVDGCLAGILRLVVVPDWYGDAEHFCDKPLYVLPRYRAGGHVLKALLESGRAIATAAELDLIIFKLDTPSRRRVSRPGVERIATLLHFVPTGSVLAFPHSKDDPHVLRLRRHEDHGNQERAEVDPGLVDGGHAGEHRQPAGPAG